MPGPTVTLTFAGESKGATTAMDEVGDSAESMSDRVASSSDGFDTASEGFDTAEARAIGFQDTMNGVGDTMNGVSEIAKGNLFEGFLTLGAGIGDLASGFTNLLIPAMKSAVGWLKTTKVATIAQAVAQGVVRAATVAWTAVQWLLNAALLANPIGLIILAIVALVAAIVILWQHSETFRDIVSAAFEWVWNAIKAGWEWVKDNWPLLLGILTGPIGLAVLAIVTYWDEIVSFVKGLPGRIADAADGMWDGITDAFKDALNWIIDQWNDFSLTIGGGSIAGVDIPSVTLSTPNIPRLHSGGRVPGSPGQDVLTLLQAGETVTSAARSRRESSDVVISWEGTDEAFLVWLRRAVRARGGVNMVFG